MSITKNRKEFTFNNAEWLGILENACAITSLDERRMSFTDKDSAELFSEFILKNSKEGSGAIYGSFMDKNGQLTWEVAY